MQDAITLQNMEVHLAAAYNADRTDQRMIRAKLMISELAETFEALANRDETALLDGLADLDYVLTGTAVTYSLPLGQGFEEVHRSNMTKSTVESAVANHDGSRGKGPDFQPPDLAYVIDRSRFDGTPLWGIRTDRGTWVKTLGDAILLTAKSREARTWPTEDSCNEFRLNHLLDIREAGCTASGVLRRY